MRRYMLNGFIALTLSGTFMPANAACSFVDKKTNTSNFAYSVSDEDCKLIKFNGESLVTIHVEYPTMKVVSYKDRSDNIMTLMISPISVPPFDINRAHSETKTVRSIDGVELLEGREKTYRVLGSDGGNAYISDWGTIFVGKLAYKDKLIVRYIFKHGVSDIKTANEFVLGFLERFLTD